MKRRLERPLALLVGLVGVVVLLEILLRLTGAFYAGIFGPSRGAGLDLEGRRVVLAMGDSMTYGVGASRGMSYPDQLGSLLQAQDPAFEVINGGLAGANTTMILSLLDDLLERLEPEVVTLLAGGTNKVNFYGLNAWLQRETAGARLQDALHHVRVWRMGTFFLHQVQGTPTLRRAVVFDGLSAGITACMQWHRRQGHTLPDAFLEGVDLLELGRYDEARQRMEGAMAHHPGDTSLPWGVATAHKGLRDDAGARSWFERCLAVDPRDPNCAYGIGELIIEGTPQNWAGNPLLREAEGWFRRGADSSPEFAANWWGLGMVRMKSNDPQGAMDAFMKCIQADPNDSRCYPNLVNQAQFTGRRRDLVAALEAVKDQSPAAADTLLALQYRRDDPAIAQWTRADLQVLVARARAAGARVVIQTYPYADTANALLLEVARAEGVPVVDQESSFAEAFRSGMTSGDLFSADGHHCNDAGYGRMAANLAPAVVGP